MCSMWSPGKDMAFPHIVDLFPMCYKTEFWLFLLKPYCKLQGQAYVAFANLLVALVF